MADMIYDFTAEPTVNPFPAPSGWEYVFGSGQIINGGWRTGTTPLEQCAMRPASLAATTDKILHVRITVPVSSGSGCGAYFGDESGNGYQLAISNSTMRANLTSAGSIGTQLGADGTPPAWTVGDTFDFYRDQSDGRMWIEYGGENIFERTSTVNTGQQNAGIFSRAGYVGVATVFDVSAPEIVSINDADTIEIGSSGNTLNTANLDVGFLSVGGIEVELTEVTPDQHTFTQPWFTDFETYPPLGSVQALAATGSDPEAPDYESATKNVTLQLPADWNGITYGTLSDDPDSLASMIEGATIETGDIHYYRPADITLYDDSTFSDAPSGTVETWLRKSATNMMIQVLIINGAAVVPGSNWAAIGFIEKVDFMG